MYCITCNADDPPHAPGCEGRNAELNRIYSDAASIIRMASEATSGHSSKLSAIQATAERIQTRVLQAMHPDKAEGV